MDLVYVYTIAVLYFLLGVLFFYATASQFVKEPHKIKQALLFVFWFPLFVVGIIYSIFQHSYKNLRDGFVKQERQESLRKLGEKNKNKL